jgi:Cu+-exporting ATPase
MVYELLNKKGLCTYYNLSVTPGITQQNKVRENKFAFLQDNNIAASLISFKDEQQTNVCFYLPQIHCSSCLWLLEHLYNLDENIISSTVNFERKEVDIIFNHKKISLQKVAELLTTTGYEPYISLSNLHQKKISISKSKIYKLGVAGFCFANIMLLSFPEYFGIDTKEYDLLLLFRYANVLLSLPVFFYAGSEFYMSAYKSLKHGFLNIDAPIVISVLITFIRSLYEVFSGSGIGYFDSMSGIIFFMLVGRVLQDKTYQQLSFDRDYTAYFPIAVTSIKNKVETIISLPEIHLNDTLIIHQQELIPADGIITKGKALIDYSFVTGESIPVEKEMGEIIYAGGKHLGNNIEILVIKEVAQSYLTKLWNKDEFKKPGTNNEQSFVHLLSKYFTLFVFFIALITGIYWSAYDISKLWNAVTAVLIVACPCALLLSNTFTNGKILSILSKNNLFIKNANTIENIAAVDTIVFDKTGTLTSAHNEHILYVGHSLTISQKECIAALANQSTHPMSKAIVQWLNIDSNKKNIAFKEYMGKGIEALIENNLYKIGSKTFITGKKETDEKNTVTYVSSGENIIGKFIFKNQYRKHIQLLLEKLNQQYTLAVLSGDNNGEQKFLRKLLGTHATILFNQKPIDKLTTIRSLQNKGKRVMMIGDGLNDAGALKQANVGIAITENSNNFTPASDGILEATQLANLFKFIQLCKANKKIVISAFIISILYNITGIYFATQGLLQPIIAAILMPCSSITILCITYGFCTLSAKFLKINYA